MYDLLLRNGRVLDGTGAPAQPADVAIQDGRIIAIGDLSAAPTSDTIDATGCLVTPGFIDIHTHSDLTLLIEGRASSSLAQGVTTQIVGNCGVSAAPTLDHVPYYGPLDPAMTRGLVCDWTGFDEYFDRLAAQGVGTNVATLVGHGNIRVAAMGWEDREATPAELERMGPLPAQARGERALGPSRRLPVAPGPPHHGDQHPTRHPLAPRHYVPLGKNLGGTTVPFQDVLPHLGDHEVWGLSVVNPHSCPYFLSSLISVTNTLSLLR